MNENYILTMIFCMLLQTTCEECKRRLATVGQLESKVPEIFAIGRHLQHQQQQQQHLNEKCKSVREAVEKLRLLTDHYVALLLDCQNCHTSIKRIQEQVKNKFKLWS